MNVIEVAKEMGLTKDAVYKMIKEGRGVGKKFYYVVGKGYRIDAKDLEVKKNG